MTTDIRLERAAFLGVERSLTGRRWASRLSDERMALAMAQRHGLPDSICRLLAAREVGLEGVPDFLEPTLRKFLPDPSHLKDMDAAVARLVHAVRQGERIVVFGDLLKSILVPTCPAIGWVKLGQPVQLSYLCALSNSDK